MDFATSLGFHFEKNGSLMDEARIIQYINLKLAAMGYPTCASAADLEFLDIARPLLSIHHEKNLRLSHALCPADQRIQDFVDDYLKDLPPDAASSNGHGGLKLPDNTFMLDRHGLARTMSLPPDRDLFT